MTEQPLSNGSNGGGDRNANGTFKPGRRGGPGSPQAKHARQIRKRLNDALFRVCSADRLANVVDAIVKLAEGRHKCRQAAF